PAFADHRVDDAGAILRPPDVGGNRNHRPARVDADPAGGVIQRILAPGDDRHVSAFEREQARDRETDALARAADDGDLFLQCEIHQEASPKSSSALRWNTRSSTSSSKPRLRQSATSRS